MSKINIKPLGDRVLVEPISAENKGAKTKSGIIIPETIEKEKPEQGKIVAVGAGRTNDKGEIIPMSVKAGQKIIFSKYGPDEIKVDGKEYYILSESNILAVIN
jgi:chaperonin GroES